MNNKNNGNANANMNNITNKTNRSTTVTNNTEDIRRRTTVNRNTEEETRAIMRILDVEQQRPPPMQTEQPSRIPSINAFVTKANELTDYIPYAKEVKHYVKDKVSEYTIASKRLLSKIYSNVTAPITLYRNYIHGLTYTEGIDYD